MMRVGYYTVHDDESIFNLYDSQFLKKNKGEVARLRKIDPGKIHAWCYEYDDPEIQGQIAYSLGLLDGLRSVLKKEKVIIPLEVLKN